MDPGAVLSEGSALYRAHWQHFLSIAALVFVVVAVLTLILSQANAFGQLLVGAISLVASFVVLGAVVKAVDDVRDGRADLSVGDTLRAAFDRIGPLLGAGIIAGIAILIGFILLIVPGLFLLTIWIAIIPLIMLEGSSVGDSFGRSRELVRGYGWPVFGVVVLTVVILFLANVVVSIVLGLFGLPVSVSQALGGFISNAVLAPWAAVVWTVTYFRLRELKAGGAAASAPAPPAAV